MVKFYRLNKQCHCLAIEMVHNLHSTIRRRECNRALKFCIEMNHKNGFYYNRKTVDITSVEKNSVTHKKKPNMAGKNQAEQRKKNKYRFH